MNKKVTRIGLIAIVSLVFTGPVQANDAGPPNVYIMLAQQQGPHVNIRLVGLGGHAFGFLRTGPQGKEVLFDQYEHDDDEAAGKEPICIINDIDYEFCEASPDGCNDCDADEVLECASVCVETDAYDIVDYCVPPGKTLYSLYEGNVNFRVLDELEIEVLPTQGECVPPDLDEGNCSVMNIGTPRSWWSLLGVLFFWGAVLSCARLCGTRTKRRGTFSTGVEASLKDRG